MNMFSGVSMCGSPQENVAYELIPASPAEENIIEYYMSQGLEWNPGLWEKRSQYR